MLSRLWRWLLPDKPRIDPDYHARMHTARAYGVAQQRESRRATREMRSRQANRVEAAYLHRKQGVQDG